MRTKATRLSATDAFFVAYQETSGVLMQLGVEVELKGRITRDDLDEVFRNLVERWPPLGQRLHRRFFGLSWEGECRTSEMIRVAETREELAEWRNRPMNPFTEPPLQLLWIRDGEQNLFAFRAHHSVVDGEGFFAVCAEGVRKLADLLGLSSSLRLSAFAGERKSLPQRRKGAKQRSPKGRQVTEAFKNLQQLRTEARSNQSARLAMRECVPGDVSIVERDLEKDAYRELQRQATELGVAPGWLCASAWMKAIHAWNVSRNNNTNPLISIEAPVSLRRGHDIKIGNLISPITLYGDATKPLDELAKELKQQMSSAVRRRTHLALPMLSTPAKFLPWRLFRKLTANPELTGFATSHFAWFEQSKAIHEEVFQTSGGALQILDQQIYTPVCLHMGAAMAILAWPERAQIFLTHRLPALSTTDAHTLLDLMVHELGDRITGFSGFSRYPVNLENPENHVSL